MLSRSFVALSMQGHTVTVTWTYKRISRTWCPPIGQNNTKEHFCPIRSQHSYIWLSWNWRGKSLLQGSLISFQLFFTYFSRHLDCLCSVAPLTVPGQEPTPPALAMGLPGWRQPRPSHLEKEATWKVTTCACQTEKVERSNANHLSKFKDMLDSIDDLQSAILE